ncbi:hypothetical protein D3C71_22660 [compost metagenome]
MARVTDTRAQVRKLANQLAAAGTTPTPTLIKQMLGKGSPNTIVSELAAWRADRQRAAEPQAPEVPVAEALGRLGAAEASELVRKAAEAAERLETAFSNLERLVPVLEAVPRRFDALAGVMDGLAAKLTADRAWMQAELDKAHARYEGVQRYAMQSIESAREETRVLRERLKEAGDGGFSKENAYRRQVDELRLLVANLKGRLEERGLPTADVAVPAALTEQDLNPAVPSWKAPRGAQSFDVKSRE